MGEMSVVLFSFILPLELTSLDGFIGSCTTEFKPVESPTMDDSIGNVLLKSSGFMKQEVGTNIFEGFHIQSRTVIVTLKRRLLRRGLGNNKGISLVVPPIVVLPRRFWPFLHHTVCDYLKNHRF